jgi:hypothetical protein
MALPRYLVLVIACLVLLARRPASADIMPPWRTPETAPAYAGATTTDPAVIAQRFGHIAHLLEGRWLGFLPNGRLFVVMKPQWIVPGVVLDPDMRFYGGLYLVVFDPTKGTLMLSTEGYVNKGPHLEPDGSLLINMNSAVEMLVYDGKRQMFNKTGTFSQAYRYVRVPEAVYRRAEIEYAEAHPAHYYDGVPTNVEFWSKVAEGGMPLEPEPAARPETLPEATRDTRPAAEFARLRDSYSARAIEQPDQAAQWIACSAVAGKRATLPSAEGEQFAARMAKTLKKQQKGKPANPCPDAIPASVW